MAKTYDDMTIPELERANQRLMGNKAAIRDEQRALVAVLDARRAEAALAADVAALEAKHGRNVQVVGPRGIESAEGVNGA